LGFIPNQKNATFAFVNYQLSHSFLLGTAKKCFLSGMEIILYSIPREEKAQQHRAITHQKAADVLAEFINLETPDDIVSFAGKWGLLSGYGGNNRITAINPPIRRKKNGELFNDPQRQLPWDALHFYQPVRGWLLEAQTLRYISELTRALNQAREGAENYSGTAKDKPSKLLGEFIHRPEQGNCWELKALGGRYSIPHTKRADNIIVAGTKALYTLLVDSNMLREPQDVQRDAFAEVREHLLLIEGKLTPVLIPETLRGLLWHTVRRLACQDVVIKKCSQCGKWFRAKHATKPDSTPSCSAACRGKKHREKKKPKPFDAAQAL
jgi:hypothetical protein